MTDPTRDEAVPIGWQPMSTAPRDEEPLLASNLDVDGGFPQIVYWDCDANNGWHVPDAGIIYHVEAFTHWRRDCFASAPAPASGVDAVAVVGWTFEFLGYDGEWGRAFAFLDQGEPANSTGAIVRNVVPVRRAA